MAAQPGLEKLMAVQMNCLKVVFSDSLCCPKDVLVSAFSVLILPLALAVSRSVCHAKVTWVSMVMPSNVGCLSEKKKKKVVD